MKIGFFDSGIGGLTVLKEALRLFPEEEYIYFADSDHAPYGSKSEKGVKELILDSIDFLADEGIDVLVLACHTASALMPPKEHRYDFPIIGMHSGLPEMESSHYGKKALICATDLSVQLWENKLKNSQVAADFLSLQQLVVFAERFEIHSPEVFHYLERKLALYNWDHYHSIILGCTHFPFFKSLIQALVPDHVEVLDGGIKTVLQMPFFPRPVQSFQKNRIKYFFSKKMKAPVYFEKYLDVLDAKKITLSKPRVNQLLRVKPQATN